jgi:hypothetical protein
MQELNIVELIEKNPISKLSKAYNSKLINKIQDNFTGFEQQLFVSSFYCYLNYDKNIDFVVDLDDVWKWLSFQQKYHAKVVLEKNFKLDIDYKNLAHATSGAVSEEEPTVKQNGGHNKQTILLTIKCFKSLCLKAQTKKQAKIHEYYMKMEEVLHQIVEKETDELRFQLEQKVYKREDKTDILLATWDSIAKASRAECISTSKLSRFIIDKDIIDDYYYTII